MDINKYNTYIYIQYTISIHIWYLLVFHLYFHFLDTLKMISLFFWSVSFLQFLQASKRLRHHGTNPSPHQWIFWSWKIRKNSWSGWIHNAIFATQLKTMELWLPNMKQFIGKNICSFLAKKKVSVSMYPFGKLRWYMENPPFVIGTRSNFRAALSYTNSVKQPGNWKMDPDWRCISYWNIRIFHSIC